MDDEHEILERELQRLRPRGPSPRLEAALARELGARRVALFPRRLAWAAAIAFAALLAAGAGWRASRPASAVSGETVARPAERGRDAVPPADGYTPVAAERTIYAVADEGFVALDDGRPARRVRHHFVDTILWRDSATNASVRWSVPGEEVRIVPASFH